MAWYDDENVKRRFEERVKAKRRELGKPEETPSFIESAVNTVSDVASGAFDIGRDIVTGTAEQYQRLGSGLARAADEAIGALPGIESATEREESARQSAAESSTAAIERLTQALEGAETEEERTRIQEGIRAIAAQAQEDFQADTTAREELMEETDPARAAADFATLALDVATAGAGGSALRGARGAMQAGRRGVQEAAEEGLSLARPSRLRQAVDAVDEAAQTSRVGRAVDTVTNPQNVRQGLVSGATLGAGYGALGEVQEEGVDATAQGALEGAAMGGIAGGAIGSILPLIGKAVASRRTGDPNAQATQVDNVRAAELPAMQAIADAPTQVRSLIEETMRRDPAAASRIVDLDENQANELIQRATLEIQPSQSVSEAVSRPDMNNVSAPGLEGRTEPLTASQGERLLTLEELVESADRPIGMTPEEYLDRRSRPQNMALEVTPGEELVIETGPIVRETEAPRRPASRLEKMQQEAQEVLETLPDDIKQKIGPLGDIIDLEDDYIVKELSKLKKRDPGLKGTLQAIKDADWAGVRANIDNASTQLARLAGKPGADFAHEMQTGATLKQKLLSQTDENIKNIEEVVKRGLTTRQQKEDSRAVAEAIATGNTENLSDTARTLYDNIVPLWQTYRTEMERQGRPVLDNYFSRVMPKEIRESDIDQALSGIESGTMPDATAVFSLHRTAEEGEVPNLYELARRYQNSMANDLAYSNAIENFRTNLRNAPEALTGDPSNLRQIQEYSSDLVKYGMFGAQNNAASSAIGKWNNLVTDNILGYSIKKAAQDLTDMIRTKGYLSKQAKGIKISDDILQAFNQDGRNYNYGILGEEGYNRRKSAIGEFLDKTKPGVRSEKFISDNNAKLGLQEGMARSPVYQDAIQRGLSDTEAQKLAWEQDRDSIVRTANWIGSTASVGNELIKALALRGTKPIFGLLPQSSLTRFLSYPLANTSELLKHLNPGEANALAAYQSGDILGSSLAKIRTNSKHALSAAKKALAEGDSKTPNEVLKLKVEVMEKAVKNIDDILAQRGPYRKMNAVKRFSALWAASTVIAMAVVGAQDVVFGTDKSKDVVPTAVQNQPFLGLDRITDPNVNLLPWESRYGQGRINTRPVVQAIPGVGGVDVLTSGAISDWLNEQIKPINKTLRDVQ